MRVFASSLLTEPSFTPQPVDAGPGFLENAAQFRDNGVKRTVDDSPIGNLLFECRPAARALRPSDRELDEVDLQVLPMSDDAFAAGSTPLGLTPAGAPIDSG